MTEAEGLTWHPQSVRTQLWVGAVPLSQKQSLGRMLPETVKAVAMGKKNVQSKVDWRCGGAVRAHFRHPA